MENTSYVAMSRQMALMLQLDQVANNIANATTAGYQAQRMMFAEVLIDVPDGEPMRMVESAGEYRDLSSGPMVSTGNDLDLAIEGDGYFVLQTPAGERYTRHGSFRLDQAGQVVNSLGYPLLSDGGPITINPEDGPISIARDGTVSTAAGRQGKVRVVRFEDAQQLEKTVNSLFSSEDPALPIERPTIEQGSLEMSNVQPVVELTSMIEIMREFQAADDMLEAEHDRLKTAITDIAKFE
jgi:flagellar basal-body rod protein FlgF